MCYTHAIHKHMSINSSPQKQLAHYIMTQTQRLWSCSGLSAF